LLIEELDADWDRVRFEFAPVDRDYFNFGMLLNGQPLGDPDASWWAGTGTWAIREVFHAMGLSMTIASTSVIDAWDTLRPAGASARQMLIDAAARKWAIGAANLRTDAGWVIHDETNRRASYGELAELASRERPTTNPLLKDPVNYRLVGHSLPRLDTQLKVTGTAEFGIDVVRPDMLYATVVHSPVAGTKVASFATNGAEKMPGVLAVVTAGERGKERSVAVVAENTWLAMQAAKKISVVPDSIKGDLVDSAALGKRYLDSLDAPDNEIFRDDGQADAVMQSSTDIVTAEYELPYLAHACMEPMNCTAWFKGSSLEVWAPTQANSMARDIGAKICALDADQVTLHTTFMGGGFGRRAEMDFVEQAVSVACQMPGRPVKLTWSREQDIRHDMFRPFAVCRVRGVTDTNGALRALDYRLSTQSVTASYFERTPTPRGGNARSDSSVVTAVNPPIYPLPNIKVSFAPVQSHVPAGYWRSVSDSWNTFFIESFIDELAVATNLDPLEFRRRALKERPRHLGVLDTVAARVERDSNTGWGFAVAESHASIVAHAIEVVIDNGRFERVTRVICAIDCGPIIHPDNVIAQMEGAIIDGLSAALYGRIDIQQGVVSQGNFDTYRRLWIAEMPNIEVYLVDSAEQRPGGVGEPGLPGVAPALTNAIFNATGERIRRLPILSR
jgi:isoquinoline 1-oxidoreductase beta subunit